MIRIPQKKGWLSGKTSDTTTNNKTDEVNALAIATTVHNATSNKMLAAVNNSLNKRTVAITSDISFKGKQTWFNNVKTILDLGGCQKGKVEINHPLRRNECFLYYVYQSKQTQAQQL